MADKSEQVVAKQAGGGQSVHPLLSLRHDIDRMFDDFVRGWPAVGGWNDAERFKALSGSSMALAPEVDVSETDEAYQITAELPGIDEKDIEVTLADDVLTLRGQKKAEREEQNQSYHLRERSYGRFQRTFSLPCDAETDGIDTRFKHGVLTVRVPKSAAAKAKVRKLEVKTG